MSSAVVTLKELEQDRENLKSENLNLKLHIQYLEEVVAEQHTHNARISDDAINDVTTASNSNHALVCRELDLAKEEYTSAKEECEIYRSRLDSLSKELDRVRLEKDAVLSALEIARSEIDKYKQQEHAFSSATTTGVQEEQMLQEELENSRIFVNAEACSLQRFEQLEIAHARIAELEAKVQERNLIQHVKGAERYKDLQEEIRQHVKIAESATRDVRERDNLLSRSREALQEAGDRLAIAQTAAGRDRRAAREREGALERDLRRDRAALRDSEARLRDAEARLRDAERENHSLRSALASVVPAGDGHCGGDAAASTLEAGRSRREGATARGEEQMLLRRELDERMATILNLTGELSALQDQCAEACRRAEDSAMHLRDVHAAAAALEARHATEAAALHARAESAERAAATAAAEAGSERAARRQAERRCEEAVAERARLDRTAASLTAELTLQRERWAEARALCAETDRRLQEAGDALREHEGAAEAAEARQTEAMAAAAAAAAKGQEAVRRAEAAEAEAARERGLRRRAEERCEARAAEVIDARRHVDAAREDAAAERAARRRAEEELELLLRGAAGVRRGAPSPMSRVPTSSSALSPPPPWLTAESESDEAPAAPRTAAPRPTAFASPAAGRMEMTDPWRAVAAAAAEVFSSPAAPARRATAHSGPGKAATPGAAGRRADEDSPTAAAPVRMRELRRAWADDVTPTRGLANGGGGGGSGSGGFGGAGAGGRAASPGASLGITTPISATRSGGGRGGGLAGASPARSGGGGGSGVKRHPPRAWQEGD